MSVGMPTSQVAVLGASGQATPVRPTGARPVVRLVSFAALGLYGTLRWSTLLSGALPRLLGLLALAVLLAAARPPLVRRSRVLAAAATLVALIALFPIAGVPLAWVFHLRIAVTVNAIGDGLTALPQALVPYSGVNQWVTLVIVLGAGVLLFDAALLVAFAPRRMEDIRRAGAALPLIALAAVPTTLVAPVFPYLDGLLLFALLAAFVWGERIGQRQAGGAVVVCAAAAVAAMFAGPALDRHEAWINPRTLAGGLTPTALDSFDWSQGYGPITWPRDDRVVMEVQARYPSYWKAENLDVFNGVGWTQGEVGQAPRPSASAAARWSETLTVTVGNMKLPQLVGAGTSQPPTGLSQHVSPGPSPGTWSVSPDLVPGDTYKVSVYAPQPTAAQLQAAGTDYGGVPTGYRTIELPPAPGSPSPSENYIVGDQVGTGVAGDQAELAFAPFHSGQPIRVLSGPVGASGAALVAGSAYAQTYQLAQQLARGTATPYEFARRVMDYLRRGFSYSENPPPAGSTPPLVNFLLDSRIGYCQQFAGAMALLLRMGGVPARVAVGFTPGHHDSATNRWIVTDLGAHAWVEAWFPRYGWRTFEATPPEDPALGGSTPTASTSLSSSNSGIVLASASKQTGGHPRAKHSRSASRTASAARRRGTPVAAFAALGLGVLALLGLVLGATRPLGTADELVGELERGMRRLGRPLPPGGTLAWIERRVSGSPEASAYVRALSLARFAGVDSLPSAPQRRALRRQLRAGLGPLGWLRGLWALPPRRHPPGPRRSPRLRLGSPRPRPAA